MKGIIKNIEYVQDVTNSWGTNCKFRAEVDGQEVYFLAKTKEQTVFKEGEETEFNIEEVKVNNESVFRIKPLFIKYTADYKKAKKRNQSAYTTMVLSYVKDLIIAGKLSIDVWESKTETVVGFCLALDKKQENDNT